MSFFCTVLVRRPRKLFFPIKVSFLHNGIENTEIDGEPDLFENEFWNNRIATTPFQKNLLSLGSAVASLVDPHRCQSSS